MEELGEGDDGVALGDVALDGDGLGACVLRLDQLQPLELQNRRVQEVLVCPSIVIRNKN